MFHLKIVAELEDFLCLAFSLGNFCHLAMKSFVQILKILFLFSLGHEK